MSFLEARAVFRDPLVVIIRDELHSVEEDRFVAIGMTDVGRVVRIAFTFQAGGIIRLISARRPTGANVMRMKATIPHRWTVDEVRRILGRPMELVIDGAVAYWLEDGSGHRLGPESNRSLPPLFQVLRLTRAGRDPDSLLLCARLESGERYEIGGGASLVGAAESAAGIPGRPRTEVPD